MKVIDLKRHNTASEDWFFLSQLLLKEAQALKDKLWLQKANTELSTYYFHKGDLDSALYFSNRTFEIANSTKDLTKISVASGNLGLIYTNLGNYDTALVLLRRAIEIDSMQKDSVRIGNGYFLIGNVYNYRSDYDIAAKYFHQALNIGIHQNDSLAISRALSSLGNVYMYNEDFDDALSYHKQCLAIDIGLGYKRDISADLSNIAMIFEAKNELDSALHFYQKALKISKTLGDDNIVGNIHNNLGLVYQKIPIYKEAEKHHLLALEIKEQIGNPEKIVSSLYSIGDLYVETAEYGKAKPFLIRGYHLAKELETKDWERNLSESLYTCYKKEGKFDRALFYHENFKKLQDTLFNAEKTAIIHDLKEKYEAEESKRKIAETQLNLEQQKAKTFRRTLWLFAIFLLLILVLLIARMLFFRNKSLRQEKELTVQRLQLLTERNTDLIEKVKLLEAKTIPPEVFLQERITLSNQEKTVIPLKDIIYVKAEGTATLIHTPSRKIWEWQNLKEISILLPSEIFIRIHRSSLVNFYQIRKRKAKTLTMSDGIKLNIGATYRKEVAKFLDSKML